MKARAKTIFGITNKLGSKFGSIPAMRNAALRLTAVLMIFALLMPIGSMIGSQKASAKSSLGISQAAPISAAPEAFRIQGSRFEAQSLQSRVQSFLAANFSTQVSEFFSSPALPEGFEVARVPTFGDKVGAALASLLGEAPEFGLRLNPPAHAGGSNKSALNPPAYAGGSDKDAPSNLERSTVNLELGTLNLEPALTPAGTTSFDFDGDGKADVGRWHSATTEFKVKNSNGGAFATSTIGTASAKPAPADFDGDGRTDAAVFDAGTWTIKYSSSGQTATISGFGQTGDKPVAGNYTGGSAAELAVYRPSSGTWYFREVGNATVTSTQFGAAGDIAVPGNYDGDSVMDFAVFRPSTGQWHFLNTNGYSVLQWGVASDIPVAADYDGDNKTDLAVYRGTSGDWWILKSSTGNTQWNLQTWGNFGDQPTPADYDGDGKADYSVWRPTTGVWHTIKSSNSSYDYQTLGVAGDTAVSSAYLKQIGGQVSGYDLAQARLSPKNSTGGTDLYSRNFSWGTSLVGLSGRSGLGAGFGMSYNSLVWTKDAVSNAVYFDADASNISPGFRFGFPTIEPSYFDQKTQRFAYLMVTPSGGRVEFRQIGASEFYETADSSYVQLKTKGTTTPNDPVENISITLTGTDGTQMSYQWKAGAFRCSQIKDRNGNFITINHDEQGLLRTVTDTLGRVITVNYDLGLYPVSITQTWKNNNGSGSDVTHTWASFAYTTKEIATNFSGLTVVGPPNGTILKVLEKVTYPDASFTQFEYNSYGQVFKVRNVAADSPSHVLNYVRTNLETPAANQTDCPRFTEMRTFVENFNGGSETLVTNSITTAQTYSTPGGNGTGAKIEVSMANHPHNAVSKTFVGETGWMEGLPIVTEDWADGISGTERKRWTSTVYTQDDPNLAYILNPRTTESKVGDTANIKKTTVEYRLLPNTTIAEYGLVSAVNVYDTNQSTVLKRAETDYNLSSIYISKRIIGLPSETRAFGVPTLVGSPLELVSRVGYNYDEGDFSDSGLNQNISPVQHDNTNYGASFVIGRGNATSTTRHDVLNQSSPVTSSVKYNTAGAPVSNTDPLARTVKIGYADSFSTTGNPVTFAYPTTLTDPANNSSTVKYRYDIGTNVWAQSPAPAGNTQGKITEREYDSLGRLLKDKVVNLGGAYTRYEYPINGVQSKVYSTIIDTNNNGADTADEVLSESWADGAGRVRQSRTEHPGSIGGYSGSLVEYDILGQVKRQSVPTEIDSNWQPAGDDATRGFLWTYEKYDWKGRVVRKINTDGTDSPTLNDSDVLITYEGCGCAGGLVTTIEGENIVETDWQGNSPNTLGRRKQKVYEDILGRNYKTEVMTWNGASVYATTVNTYNGRDQITETRQYAGDTNNSTYRDVTMTYDGNGRMKTRHYPIENAGTNTSWTYNNDDSINTTTDPRGVVTNFNYYPTTGLLNQITYDVPANQAATVPDTPNVTFSYDNLGNRTAMTDGSGTSAYTYSQLSQLTSESKTFTGLTGNFTINYEYNLSGGLKTMSDPQDSASKVIYNHDRTGRVVGADMQVQSVITQYIRDTKYRAWGDLKEYKNDIHSEYPTVETFFRFSYDNRLQISGYESGRNSQPVPVYLQRYADGKLKKSFNGATPWHDRSYNYDHAGRMTQALTGKDAHGGDPAVVNGPYKQNLTYNSFSETTATTGKNWGIPATAYGKLYDSYTGRDAITGYDAAGNIVTDRVQTIPTVFNRTMKYDAAGRQVETFDPALRPCCEVDQTSTNRYDGNGWLVKGEGLSTVGSSATYNFRSTVLGGETVGTMGLPGGSIVSKTFTAPVIGGKLTYSTPVGQYAVNFTRTGPEGLFEYGADLPEKAFDPRGADTGLDDPSTTGGSGSGGYPGGGADPQNYGRCVEGGVPMPCDMQAKFENAFNRIQDSINADSGSAGSAPSHESGHSSSSHKADDAKDESAEAQATTETDKPEPNPEKSGTIDPASIPCVDSDFVICTRAPRIGGGVDASVGMDTDDNRTLVARAIQDVKDIFGTDNECSNFFGLARPYDSMFEIVGRSRRDATGVANTLGNQLLGENGIGFLSPSKANNTTIGIEMSPGKNSYTSNTPDGLRYRVFSKAVVNIRGLFFNSVSIGGYTSTSRAGRALLLLHEIAHMIITGVTTDKKGKATGSTYLILPNDGDGDETQDESVANSKIVADKCKKQLDALK